MFKTSSRSAGDRCLGMPGNTERTQGRFSGLADGSDNEIWALCVQVKMNSGGRDLKILYGVCHDCGELFRGNPRRIRGRSTGSLPVVHLRNWSSEVPKLIIIHVPERLKLCCVEFRGPMDG